MGWMEARTELRDNVDDVMNDLMNVVYFGALLAVPAAMRLGMICRLVTKVVRSRSEDNVARVLTEAYKQLSTA